MSLTAQDMQRLEHAAREIVRGGVTYIADALRCLLDTRDPIDALTLLRALWGSSHAKRDQPKAGLDDVGQWLEQRIRNDIDISAERLALELGWLQRLVTVHGAPNADRDDHDRRPSRRAEISTAPFGAHIELLRARREAALARAAGVDPVASRGEESARAALPPPPPPRREHLPDVFEVRFANWQVALEAFKHARKRLKEGKSLKHRSIDVTPVEVDLQPLATDLACSLLHTDGMTQLLDQPGDLPTFWIATADLTMRDGKRIASRISLAPAGHRAP